MVGQVVAGGDVDVTDLWDLFSANSRGVEPIGDPNLLTICGLTQVLLKDRKLKTVHMHPFEHFDVMVYYIHTVHTK